MKRIGNIFEKVYSIENLELAHKNASKGKAHYREVKMINSNPEFYLSWLSYILKENLFITSPYDPMTKKSDSGKVREILKLPYYPDRIVHHAIIQVVGDMWIKTLIRDTFSSIRGRGIHDGVRRLKKALLDKENTKYCLKLDIKKYYQSIPNDQLKKIIGLKIKDNKFLNLIYEIIDSTKGVPIGNYLSQYFGNLYISSLDHKIKSQSKHYFRYCDDIVILSGSKADLREILENIREILNEKGLLIKENWQIFPVENRGIDFLGYRFFHDYTLLRKSIKVRMRRKFNLVNKSNNIDKAHINSIMSYNGWLTHANCKNLQNSLYSKDICQKIKHKSLDLGIKNPIRKIK